jgi:cytochrome c-type protein NapC
MHFPALLLILLIALTVALIAVFVIRPQTTATTAGKIAAFLGFFAFPLLCVGMGFSSQMDNSKSKRFCLSCHIMEPYGKSLWIDDPGHVPASHFQNHRVPPDQACYTCHTNYAMFGGFKAKLNGLHHVYMQYLGKPHNPIRLYEPYNNRECLHCHQGARSFEEGAVHTADPDLLPAVKANKLSCLSSGCHDVVHNADQLSKVKFWKGAN